MATTNTDPRYVRSRQGLRSALIELAHEDPSSVTVSAVCERTGIDRATFYRHFSELDELIADTLGDLAEQRADEWRTITRGTGDQLGASTAILAEYCRHVADNWTLYRWALGPTGSARSIHEVLEKQIASSLEELRMVAPSMDDDERDMMAAYAGGGVFAAFIYWLKPERPAISPEEFAARALKHIPVLVHEPA